MAKTPARPLTKIPLMDLDGPESAECTPRPATSRGFGTLPRTCHKMRPLLQSSFFLKKIRPFSDAVKVFIRVKPVMEEDLKQGRSKEAVTVCEREGKTGIAIPTGNGKENWFADFDGVLDNATNQQVFDEVGRNLLSQYVKGINLSIMAYGQTGSGKTYTMFGSNDTGTKVQGLLHMVIKRINEEVCIGTPLVRASVSVFEVYNDEVYSLLDASGVDRRILSKGMADYHNHKAKPVSSADEAIDLVLEALQSRMRDTTARNAASSRSHAFVKLRLEQLPLSREDRGTESTLFLVDLAGSESYNNANGSVQQKETIHINAALSALERVFHAMVTRSAHFPYRDSLLTQVLQEGLDPQRSLVAMVSTVSRFQSDLTVTKSTLGFAQRARNIRTFAQVNQAPKRPMASCPEEMQRQLQNLQAINNKLRQQLADLDSAHYERSTRERHLEAMRMELLQLAEVHTELQRTSARHQHETEAALEVEREVHQGTRQQLAELQASHSDMQSKVASAEEAVRAEARGAAELRSQLAEAGKEAAKLKGELVGARALTEEVRAQHRAAQEQVVQLKGQLTQLKGQLAVAEAGVNEQHRELQRELDCLRSQAELASSNTEAEAGAMHERIGELEQQVEEVREHAAVLVQQLQEVRQQAAKQAAELQQAREEAARQAQQLDESHQQAAQQAEQFDQALRLAAEQVAELEQVREQAASQDMALDMAQQLAEQQAANLDAVRQLAAQQAADLEEGRRREARQQAELVEAREQVAQLQEAAAAAAAGLGCGEAAEAEAASQEATLLRRELQQAERRASEHAGRVRQLLGSLAAVHDRRSGADSLASALRGGAADDCIAAAEELQEAAMAAAVAVARAEGASGVQAGHSEERVKEGDDGEGPAAVEKEQSEQEGGGEGEGTGREEQEGHTAPLTAVDSLLLREARQQLEACTEQLAAAEGELAAAKEQLEAAEVERGTVMEQLRAVRGSAQAEIGALREQLLSKSAETNRLAAEHAAALAAAVQDARAASEAAASQRLAPLQTECEHLRAMCNLSEQQLSRLQAECERLWVESSAATELVARLQAECEELRESGRRAEAVAAERLVKLEAQKEREAGPRPDAVKQLQDRVRALEAEKKRSEADQRGQLELKEKLIRQLELMNHQLQSELAKVRQEAVSFTDHPAGGSTSPYAVPQLSARSPAPSPSPGPGPGPGLAEDGTGTPVSSGAPPGPSRTPLSGGILLLNRTTTGSAAALARNNTRTLRANDFSTPPPAPRAAPAGGPPPATPFVNLVTPTSAGGLTPNSAAAATPAAAQTPTSPGGGGSSGGPAHDVLNLVTPCSTPGPSEPQLTPSSIRSLDDGLVIVVRGQQRGQLAKLDSGTSAFRNQINF